MQLFLLNFIIIYCSFIGTSSLCRVVAVATGTFTVFYMAPPPQRRGTISRKQGAIQYASTSMTRSNGQRPRDKEQYSTHRCAATSTQGASVRNDARSALVASGTSMVAANKTSREQESRFIHFSGSITDAEFLPRLKNIIDIKRVVRGAQFRHKTIYWILPLPDASSKGIRSQRLPHWRHVHHFKSARPPRAA